MRPDRFKLAKEWIYGEATPMEEAKATWEAMDIEFNENRRMQLAEGGRIPFGKGGMQQLVQPSADGSRPGYGGKRKTSTEGLPQFVTTDEVNPGKYTVRVKGSNLNEPFFKQNLSLEEATKLAKKYKPAYTIDTDLLSQLIEQANNSNKIYSKEDIMEMYAKRKKTVGTTKRKTSYGDIKTYPKLKTKTFDSAGTLLSPEKKVERVFQEILSMDEAVPNIDLGGVRNKNLSNYKKYIIKETGIGEHKLGQILKTLPDFKNNLESFKYLANSGVWKTDLVDMSLSDQLKWAFDAKEGKPRFKNIGYLVADPNYVTMDFALRNWNLNKGKGKIKFYDANGNIIKWKNGLELPVTKVTFSHEGNRFGIGKKDNALNLRLVGKEYFPEVYQNLDYINQLKATMVDNPYKPGKQISFMDLMKRVYIKDKGYKAGAPLFSIFHGKGGVGKEPFKNLSFGMQDLNQALYKIEKTIPLKGLRKKITNQAIGELKNLGGEDLINAIIDQQSIIAQDAAKGKLPIGTLRDRAILEVAKDKTLGPRETKFMEKQYKELLKKFEAHPGGCGKAAGGRILFSEGSPDGKITKCAQRGGQAFIDDLKKGNYSKATVNILKGGGNILKNILDPKELLKMRNYFGPVALGFMAAFEGGVIGDDVIRQGTPLNESLANNWLTRSFLPYTKDYAQAKNLLESGTVPSNMKKYVQDVVTFNESLKDMQNIQGNVDSRLVDDSFGMIDGSSMYSKEKEDKDVNNLIKKMSTISEDVFTPGSAKALEMKRLQDEMEATRMAKKGFSPVFGFGGLKDRNQEVVFDDYISPVETPKDLRPITYMDAEYEDVKTLPAAERKRYEDYFTKEGILQPRQSLSELMYDADTTLYDEILKDYNAFQRQKFASQYPGYYGTQEPDRFMEGGIASLNVKKK